MVSRINNSNALICQPVEFFWCVVFSFCHWILAKEKNDFVFCLHLKKISNWKMLTFHIQNIHANRWVNKYEKRTKGFLRVGIYFSHFISEFWFFSYFFRFFVNNLVESFDMVFFTARLELRWNSTRNHLRYVCFTCELHSWKSNYIVVNVILYGILFRKLHVHTMWTICHVNIR